MDTTTHDVKPALVITLVQLRITNSITSSIPSFGPACGCDIIKKIEDLCVTFDEYILAVKMFMEIQDMWTAAEFLWLAIPKTENLRQLLAVSKLIDKIERDARGLYEPAYILFPRFREELKKQNIELA